MARKAFKFPEGHCHLVFEDPERGASRRAPVLKVSSAAATVRDAGPLEPGRCVSAVLEFDGGPRVSLLGRAGEGGGDTMVVRWEHASPDAAGRLENLLVEHVRSVSAPAPEIPAGTDRSKTVVIRKRDAGTAPERAPEPAGSRHPAGGAVPSPARAGGLRDVSVAIRERARTVRTRDIAARAETVQVLGLSAIRSLVQEAVSEAAEHLEASLHEADRRRLLEEAEEVFKERLEAFQAEKRGLEAKSRSLEEQLRRATALLREERERVVRADQFTVSEAGLVEIEKRLARLVDRALRAGAVEGDLEQEMRGVVSRLLDDEREKIREQAERAQGDRVELLERKVERLARSLDEAERERRKAERRAQALEASGHAGLRHLMLPGLDEDDPDREKKLALLKEIAEHNREVRWRLRAGFLAPGGAGGAAGAPAVRRIVVPPVTPPPLERREEALVPVEE